MAHENEHKDDAIRPLPAVIPVLIVVAIALVIGIIPRISQQSELKATAATENHAVIVDVVTPRPGPRFDVVNVPGMIEAYEQTAVNARTTGYAQRVLVNIGDRVKAGQVLAIVTAPDQDQEVVQARAQLVQSQDARAQASATYNASLQTVAQDEASLEHARAALLAASDSLLQLRYELTEAQRTRSESVAALSTAQANERYAYLTNDRNQNLAKQGYVSQETADQDLAAYQSAEMSTKSARAAVTVSDAGIQAAQSAVDSGVDNLQEAKEDIQSAAATVAGAVATAQSNRDAVAEAVAGVDSNRANLQHLVVLQEYEIVRSPFSGIVTARNIDPGAYISNGGSSSSTTVGSSVIGDSATGATASGSSSSGNSASGSSTGSLFTVARYDQLRVYVNLPQSDSAFSAPGSKVRMTVSTFPGRTFTGVVSHSTVVLDPGSRTLIAEIDMPNPGGLLRPGMFSMVELRVPQQRGVLLIPDSALVTGP
ncbi:MAG: efflux RND transporter periplasmic adaptor subunit, partial [Capsulimonadaceae bacterium]